MNYKILKAAQLHITVETDIVIPYELNVKEFDMITILGNLLDNSIEAVKQLPIEERIIKFSMRYDRMRLIIQMKNRFNENVKINSQGDILTSKENINYDHGFGIKNIKYAISNYHGKLTIITENNIFKTYIILYINSLSPTPESPSK